MYLYGVPAAVPRYQGLGQPMYFLGRGRGFPSRFGEPPAVATPELILDEFGFNLSDLTPLHKNKIDNLAQRITDSWKPGSTTPPIIGVRAVGHTDDVGGIDYNVRLGQRRAEAVLGRLTGLILGGDIDTFQRVTWTPSSKGKSDQKFSLPEKNRRVEIFLDFGRIRVPPPPRQRDQRCVQGCNAAEQKCLDTTLPRTCNARRADCVRGC